MRRMSGLTGWQAWCGSKNLHNQNFYWIFRTTTMFSSVTSISSTQIQKMWLLVCSTLRRIEWRKRPRTNLLISNGWVWTILLCCQTWPFSCIKTTVCLSFQNNMDTFVQLQTSSSSKESLTVLSRTLKRLKSLKSRLASLNMGLWHTKLRIWRKEGFWAIK